MSRKGRHTGYCPPKGPIGWMAGNAVASNLLMLLLLVGGLIMGRSITQEVFPEFSLDSVTVSVAYPGASPEEVEKGVILAIEQAVQGLEGVDEITSTASEGSGRVRVQALEGADVDRLWQEVQSEVDRITTLPDDTKEPQVSIDARRREVLDLGVVGNVGERALRQVAENLRETLLLDPRITQAELDRVQDLEIHVEVPLEELRRYDLTLQQVAERIATSSVELGGGSLRTDQGEVLVRVTDRRDWASEFANIPVVVGQDGAKVLLEDIATIREGFEDANSWEHFDAEQAITVEVYRVGKQTPTEVSQAAREIAAEFAMSLPASIRIVPLRDRSEIFQQRADLLLRNAWLGLGLVFLFLAVFLEIRLAFWVSLGIPISFLGSFLFLSSTDFSINMVTMFAFIVTLGIVVDDAVVVGENIYHKRRQGMEFLRAAVEGAKEVAGPVTFSVITNIVAFMPLYFVPGTMGKVFRYLPIVVASVFAVSLIESLFILPAHLGHGSQRSRFALLNPLIRLQARFSGWFETTVYKNYGKLLDLALRRRYVLLCGGVAVLAGTIGFVLSGRMGMELFPKVESDYAVAEAVLPYGASEQNVRRVEQRLVAAARQVVEENGGPLLSEGILARVEENQVHARIFLTPPDVRPMSTAELTRLWRQAAGQISGLETITFESDRGGPGGGKALTVQLSHRDTEVLDAAGLALAEELRNFDGVSDIDDGAAKGKRQFDISLTPTGEAVGLTSSDVARQVRNAFLGAEALRQQRGRNEITVRVRLPATERANEETLEDLVILLPNGSEMLLRDVANVAPGRAYTSIRRTDGRRVSAVTANVTPRPLTETIVATLKADILPKLTGQFPGLSFSFEGRQADLRESLASLKQGLLMALLCIFALLAIPFRSYLQPMIIMFCIPFGIIGAVFGHLVMGYSLSLMSMFGIVALTGVVVNDSLVLIDFANRRVAAGNTPLQAVKSAGIQRFRPIMLTTLTTCGGLGPMILETSRQARFLIPMAISLGFGILFATVITLLLVPSLYMALEDIRGLFGRATPIAREGKRECPEEEMAGGQQT